MFGKIKSLFLALSISLIGFGSSGAASSIQGEHGEFFYRYKDEAGHAVSPGPGGTSKDVTAFYVGLVGYQFSELLPLKPEWEDDEWKIVDGVLPAGLSFDETTRTFVGTPTDSVVDHIVELEGFDANGESVATATASFDIHEMRGTPVRADLYAHTGKYKLHELAIPSGLTVHSWQHLYAPPPGIVINGPYMEGSPLTAGRWHYVTYGFDYMGEAVVTFFGDYVVEDGPTFPPVADMVYDLPNPKQANGLKFKFGPTPVLRSLRSPSEVRYSLELAPSETLPGSVVLKGGTAAPLLDGVVSQPYDTATVRWKAVDVDDVLGYSNWFKFGSDNPHPVCVSSGAPPKIFFSTDRDYAFKIGDVEGGLGVKSYSVVDGALPAGLTLDANSGLVVGRPKTSENSRLVTVRIAVANGGNSVSTDCLYDIQSVNGLFRLSDATPLQDRHIRLGDTYSGTLAIKGGQTPFDTSIDDAASWPSFAFTSATLDNASVTVAGTPAEAGVLSVPFVSTNGDGNETRGNLTVNVHDALSVGDVGAISVKRLAASSVWGSVPYDEDTVIPDVATGGMPRFSLSGPRLPDGIDLDAGGRFVGATSDVAQSYGPYTVTITDYSGDTDTSDPFMIEVEPREDISLSVVEEAVFTAMWDRPVSRALFAATQPPLAKAFGLTWTLNGPVEPWMDFDRDTGAMTVADGVSRDLIGTYGPFTVSVVDDEGSTATSEPFHVRLQDWPEPAAKVDGKRKGTVSGDTARGETATSLSISGLQQYVDEDTVIGGLGSLKFLSVSPASPAGLTFNAATGTLSGTPTSEYNGNVEVTFEDGAQRTGTISLPLEVRAYPAVDTTGNAFDLPRLALAENLDTAIEGRQVAGFWSSPSWSVDTSNGTDIAAYGLAVNQTTGALRGSTKAAVGTVIPNVILVATSTGGNGETLVSRTPPFSIAVTDAVPLGLSYVPSTHVWYSQRNPDGSYRLRSQTSAIPKIAGSYVGPLDYALDLTQAQANGLPTSVSVNTTTGRVTGTPGVLGDWTVPAKVTDAEGRVVDTDLRLFSTLRGPVSRTTGNSALTLRGGEPFRTAALGIADEVAPVTFSVSTSTVPASVMAGFDPLTGAFDDAALFDAAVSNYDIALQVVDAHGRSFATPAHLIVTVRPPLAMTASSTSITSKQYSAMEDDVIDVSFKPKVQYQIGNLRYALEGDVPGTLVNKVYDANGVFRGYEWNDGAARTLPASTPESQLPDLLPFDALVFDTMSATLKGIPSEAGTFQASLVVYDDHADGYVRPVPTQAEYNSASVAVTFTVAVADDMVLANSASSETIHRYTSQATLRTSVENAAYGRPVTWTRVSGSLPQNVGEAKSPASVGYSGYPEETGTFGGIVWQAEDAAGRKKDSAPVEIVVIGRQAPELVVDSPIYAIVNQTDIPQSVTARNTAYGLSVPDGDWTVSGVSSLPPGVSYAIAGNKVSFSGVPTVIGRYDGVTVSAVDSLGAPASVSVAFEILSPTGDIGLDVSNIRTKVGYPFAMQSTATNTYGTVRFYSYDISGDLAKNLSLGGATGLVSGSFAAVGDLDFDVYVSDATNRVTSKPVLVSVLPSLRVTVPAIVEATQGMALNRTVATDYVLGTVSYEKDNPSAWPSGFAVNPQTGEITAVDASVTPNVNRVVAAPGTYAGLRIKAVDSFTVAGVVHTDVQVSNDFSVAVEPTPVMPDVIDPSGLKVILGTEGVPMTAWKSTVREKGTSKAWSYGGTVYTANYDLSVYGLTLNPSTGEISGTPTAPFIIRDFAITVTSARGDSDTTSTFWIGVAPKDPMAVNVAQKTHYKWRMNVPIVSDPIVVDNVVGILSFSKPTNTELNWDTTTGVISYPAWNKAAWVKDGLSYTTKITDEFNRTLNWTFTADFKTQFAVENWGAPYAPGSSVSVYPPVIASGAPGSLVFSSDDIPAYLSINPTTGVVSGIMPVDATGRISFTVKVVDSVDGASASALVSLASNTGGQRYWKMNWTVGSAKRSDTYEMQLLGASGENYSLYVGYGLGTVWSSGDPYNGLYGAVTNVVDGLFTTGNPVSGNAAKIAEFGIDFGPDPNNWPVIVGVRFGFSSTSTLNGKNASFSSSDDKVNWTLRHKDTDGVAVTDRTVSFAN